jgi:hypothetical protein
MVPVTIFRSTMTRVALIALLLTGLQTAASAVPMAERPETTSSMQPVQERRQVPGTYRKTAPRPGIVNGVRGSTMRRAGDISHNGYWYPPSAFGSSSNSGRVVPNAGQPVPQQ